MTVPCNSFRNGPADEFDMIPSGQSHDFLCNTQLAFPQLVYVCCCGNDCLRAILFSVCNCTVRFTAVYSSSCCSSLLLTVSVRSTPLIPSNILATRFFQLPVVYLHYYHYYITIIIIFIIIIVVVIIYYPK
jgi:hypothetical protein